ncbi:hypothetical protein ACQ3I4_14360 [Zafaria sp. Z1313]|uniref:hypothetical protein n=1 Tax=unclassified Zafaria TaxID=2828765 RepID=UPI002E771E5A|nr:hypothetical protein [Zafaria sp. J156]MEE1622106.1 hypothetical protein [Zafaria sp. J156]
MARTDANGYDPIYQRPSTGDGSPAHRPGWSALPSRSGASAPSGPSSADPASAPAGTAGAPAAAPGPAAAGPDGRQRLDRRNGLDGPGAAGRSASAAADGVAEQDDAGALASVRRRRANPFLVALWVLAGLLALAALLAYRDIGDLYRILYGAGGQGSLVQSLEGEGPTPERMARAQYFPQLMTGLVMGAVVAASSALAVHALSWSRRNDGTQVPIA